MTRPSHKPRHVQQPRQPVPPPPPAPDEPSPPAATDEPRAPLGSLIALVVWLGAFAFLFGALVVDLVRGLLR
jgi:hypothetical protein